MSKHSLLALLAVCPLIALAQNSSQPAITVYNQNFAVIRESVPLNLKSGPNEVRFDGITSFLEPDSVILRDPSGKHQLQVLEQDYRSDIASQQALLAAYEGKTIDFLVQNGDRREIVKGKIIRAGVSLSPMLSSLYGVQQYYAPGQNSSIAQPIVEVDGRVQFSLPGIPLFPSVGDDSQLKPALFWNLQSDKSGAFGAELSYVTGGMTWEADYNIVSPTTGDDLDLIGWVTLDNHTGRTFQNARIQLMAGDVNKLQPPQAGPFVFRASGGIGGGIAGQPPVQEKAFDEYHLYTLQRTSTLRNGETKQVEFLRASKIPAKRIYVYEGYKLDMARYPGQQMEYLREQRNIGMTTNTRVFVMREFKNTEASHLGMPIPRGRMRFYRQDDSGQLQFIGENTIDHTPKDETVRVYTGDAFDISADRRRTNFKLDNMREYLDESYEVKVRNHKKEAVQVTVVEHFYRGNWDITSKSQDFKKKDSQTAEFTLQIPPDGEQTLLYSVHYTW